jgi:hypothetical protein
MTAEFDIRAEADRVIALLQQQRAREGLELLSQLREGRARVVQESLDRFVAEGAAEQLQRLRQPGGANHDPVALRRLADAASPYPRFPLADEMTALSSDVQRHDVYASIVATRGNPTAQEAMTQREQRVILGLRQEDSTLVAATLLYPGVPRPDLLTTPDVDESRLGTGVYDDRIVVLWKDADGSRQMHEVPRANTEPTAQYDHHAGNDLRHPRPFSGGGVETRSLDASAGFGHIGKRRKIEGEDVNGDSYRDLGRLAAGTIEMQRATHPRGNHQEFAMRPTEAQVQRHGAGLVQRDTNGDGWFTQDDINGVQALNNSFKIHRGSRDSTDSAGCQTIHTGDYPRFIEVVQGDPQQNTWQYVLTATSPGMFRDVVAGPAEAQQNQQRAPQPPREQPGPPVAPHREGRHGPPPVGPHRERAHGAHDPQANLEPGPFSDPLLNQAYAAALRGDDAGLDRIAREVSLSDEGQRLAQLGRDLAEQQQLQEQQMTQTQSRGRRM